MRSAGAVRRSRACFEAVLGGLRVAAETLRHQTGEEEIARGLVGVGPRRRAEQRESGLGVGARPGVGGRELRLPAGEEVQLRDLLSLRAGGEEIARGVEVAHDREDARGEVLGGRALEKRAPEGQVLVRHRARALESGQDRLTNAVVVRLDHAVAAAPPDAKELRGAERCEPRLALPRVDRGRLRDDVVRDRARPATATVSRRRRSISSRSATWLQRTSSRSACGSRLERASARGCGARSSARKSGCPCASWISASLRCVVVASGGEDASRNALASDGERARSRRRCAARLQESPSHAVPPPVRRVAMNRQRRPPVLAEEAIEEEEAVLVRPLEVVDEEDERVLLAERAEEAFELAERLLAERRRIGHLAHLARARSRRSRGRGAGPERERSLR